MRARMMMGVLCAALTTVGGAAAQERDMSPAERAGYDGGTDAAVDFCRDLRARPHERGFGGGSVSRDYERGCKMGFDEHIDSNRTCQDRIEKHNAYNEMRAARRYTCS